MHSRASHLVAALIGLASAFAVGYLLFKSAVQLGFVAMQSLSLLPAGTTLNMSSPPGTFAVHGSVSAAGMLLGIGVIVGVLASTRRLSPLAPLLAGLPLLAVALAYQFAYLRTELWTARNLPANLGIAADPLRESGIWYLLGGILLVSAAMPWRWTGKVSAAAPGTSAISRNRTAIGVLIGVLGLPGLWYLLQLADPAGFGFLLIHGGLPHVFDLIWLAVAATVIVIAVIAASSWVSPVAAAIIGIPLLVVGLLLVIAPVGAARWTHSFVWGGQPITIGLGQSLSLGVLVLVGGLLVVAAAAPWRWRQPSDRPAASPAPVEAAA